MTTTTLTFGDFAENHVGMQLIGSSTPTHTGLTFAQLRAYRRWFRAKGHVCELVALHGDRTDREPAYVLVVRGGVSAFADVRGLAAEQAALKPDKHAFMRDRTTGQQRVMQKRARWNLCFADRAQAPDYAAGKGTIVDIDTQPHLAMLRSGLATLDPVFGDLPCEGNYYYDVRKCYIGFHGDTERKILVAARLGADMPLWFRWWRNGAYEGVPTRFNLHDGDMYFATEKAVGSDWKFTHAPTVRHAAGHASLVGHGQGGPLAP